MKDANLWQRVVAFANTIAKAIDHDELTALRRRVAVLESANSSSNHRAHQNAHGLDAE